MTETRFNSLPLPIKTLLTPQSQPHQFNEDFPTLPLLIKNSLTQSNGPTRQGRFHCKQNIASHSLVACIVLVEPQISYNEQQAKYIACFS